MQNILKSAFIVSEHLDRANVLIYCPFGVNATCLLSSLAQIISESHYRTFDGLRALIYKEWHYYQHDFAQKNLVFSEPKPTLTTMQDTAKEEGFMARAVSFFNSSIPDKTSTVTYGNERRIEPIFLLFCDALQQMIKMNPLAFEYSPSFVLFLARELNTNKFWEFV